jgi:hypothetical protein
MVPEKVRSQPRSLPEAGFISQDNVSAIPEIAGRDFGDFVQASDYDIVTGTSKTRRFGFHECVDTEEMFLRLFAGFRRSRGIPRSADRRLKRRGSTLRACLNRRVCYFSAFALLVLVGAGWLAGLAGLKVEVFC